MKIITKYYDKKGVLKPIIKQYTKNSETIRFKILENGKSFPCCDFHGKCTNFAYAEVFPFIGKKSKKSGWSYLCRKHYFEERKKLNGKLPACLNIEY